MATGGTEKDELSGTTSERVVQRLRDDILDGRFRPGDRIKLADFADLYGLSHMPVREALRRLEAEGLLDIAPHRGATVRAVDEAFLRNIYDIREALEGILAERCAERAGQYALADLDDATDRYAQAAARSDERELLVQNRRFHGIIARASGNEDAVRLLETGRVLVEALRLRQGRGPGRTDVVVAEHRQIRDAIASRNAGQAGALARAHVAGARDDLIERLRSGGVVAAAPLR